MSGGGLREWGQAIALHHLSGSGATIEGAAVNLRIELGVPSNAYKRELGECKAQNGQGMLDPFPPPLFLMRLLIVTYN